jgi:nucleotide-binding universal stress UspA family protein
MTYLVPFDDSPPAREALAKAYEFADDTAEEVVAVSVITDSPGYAREKEWIRDDESFEVETVAHRIRESVHRVAPEVRVRIRHIEGRVGKGSIASRIRDIIIEEDADVVFLGSENAGRVATPLGSIGGQVASGDYDVYLVRSPPGNR